VSVALVTGASRGLGKETAARLHGLGWEVFLAARDGDAIEAEARRLGPRAHAVPLDVTSAVSRQALVARLPKLDAVVSNAGIALDGFDSRVVRETLAVNVHGATGIVRSALSLLGPGARVVLVSSGMGELSGFDRRIRARFDPPPGEDDVLAALDAFSRAEEAGRLEAEGWPRSAYRVTKVALNSWTRSFADEVRTRGILVNAVCPGWVRTAMGGRSAPRSVEEGAAGIVWAATLPPDGPTGGFFRDGHPIAW
jgi:NAD(P)-dependent dehydrogenase (short-subunit alcohol dehydrogenase family)